MLNHFSVSNMEAISNDPNDLGHAFQVAVVESNTDGSNKTKVFKVKKTDIVANKLSELANLLATYTPTADTLEEAKFLKLNEIENAWIQRVREGWDSGQGRLGLTAEDVALLSGAFALAKEAAALGLPLPKLITQDDTTMSFETIAEMTTLLLQYGAARAQLSETFAERRKAVETATTLEELENL